MKHERYAQGTTTPVEKSRAEVEVILKRYGATGFGYSWDRRLEPRDDAPGPALERNYVMIAFQIRNRRVRLDVPMPTPEDLDTGQPGAKRSVDLAERERWRALVLVLKAKLEAVKSGISSLEHEFLAGVVMADGRTIGEAIIPRLSEAVEHGRLLPAKGER